MEDVASRFLSRAIPGVQALRPYNPGKPLEALEREYGVRDAIKLASNENPLGPSPRALEVINGELPQLARYPDDSGYRLKDKLAQRHGVEPAQVVLGCGSSNILELVVRSFAGPGEPVVFSEFAFAMYPIITCAVGARPVQVPARDYGHDLAAMAAAVTADTKVVFIANPNNPTGTWVEAQALRRFLEAVPPQVIVVVDEAYFEYAIDNDRGIDYPDSSRWLGEFPNLVVTRTFSKAYALAGLRVGYGLCHPAVADLLNRVRAPFNVNALAMTAALAAVDDDAHLREGVVVNRVGLKQLDQGCRELGLEPIPSLANFICMPVADAAAANEALLRAGVIVRPRPSPGMDDFLRVSVGTEAENRRFLATMAGLRGQG